MTFRLAGVRSVGAISFESRFSAAQYFQGRERLASAKECLI